tara:strand:- start:227 stop:574 length:348 start_codon:yes stop_codon:yes gene_type:complete
MERDGIMNLVTGTWAWLTKKIKNKERKINMEKAKTKKYMVMSKFNHSDRFNLEKQFVNRHSADAYVELMIEDREYEGIEYFLFEQSHDYQHKDEGYDTDVDKEENWKDMVEVANG